MPTIQWNKSVWDGEYDWSRAGDEWSDAWGGELVQWNWTLRPRIQSFLSTGTILELGPGFGRWTQFLREECQKMILVDISESCIEACRKKFGQNAHMSLHVNDGFSLEMVENDSVDFVFSFDSLVHAEVDVLESYLKQLKSKLNPGGTMFLHHSNLGHYRYFHIMRGLEKKFLKSSRESASRQIPPSTDSDEPQTQNQVRGSLSNLLMLSGLVDRTHMRALSVSADTFAGIANRYGLSCLAQEIFPWGNSRRAIDCISVVVHEDDPRGQRPRRIVNPGFMREASYVRKMGAIFNDPATREEESS